MKRSFSIVRSVLTVLLCLHALAPYAHLAHHALERHLDVAMCSPTPDEHASFHHQGPVPHVCSTCQGLLSQQGLTTIGQPAADTFTFRTPETISVATLPAYPCFDFNVAVARGPPAPSLNHV